MGETIQTDDQHSPCISLLEYMLSPGSAVSKDLCTPGILEWSRLAIASFMTLCLLNRISNASVAATH